MYEEVRAALTLWGQRRIPGKEVIRMNIEELWRNEVGIEEVG